MNISYKEKTLWVSLLSILIVAWLYADAAWGMVLSGADATAFAGILLRAVIALIVIEIVLNGVLAMDEQKGVDDKEDERDVMFKYKANEWGYWVLAAGVITCLVHYIVSNLWATNVDASNTILLAPIPIKLVFVFVLSEVARFATQIYYYRVGS